jgi:hypothetical protein
VNEELAEKVAELNDIKCIKFKGVKVKGMFLLH